MARVQLVTSILAAIAGAAAYKEASARSYCGPTSRVMLNRQIKESDWKLFRELHRVALERFCQRVIREINEATSNCDTDFHERYLKVFSLIMDRNEQMARAFDDMRRSTAIVLISNIRAAGLLTDEEFSEFSEETRLWVESILGIRRR